MTMRMLPVVALLALLALATHAPAQLMLSSPAGYEFVEGGGAHTGALGTAATLRFQQVDSTQALPIANIDALLLRRDGHSATNGAYAARTIELELTLAEGDITQFGATYAGNLQGNSTVVLPRTKIRFPDWTQQPAGLPSGALVTLPFAQPWSYPGRTASGKDLVWEIVVHSNTMAGQPYPFDFANVVPNAIFGQKVPSRSGHVDLGFGCQVFTGESHMDIDVWNYGSKFTLDAHLHTAASAPVVLNLGAFNANLNLPGLCGTVYALPGLSLPVGKSDANGDLDVDIDPIPYDANLIGIDIYAQAVAPDASQPNVPIAFSSGAKMTVPPDPSGPAVGHAFGSNLGASRASVGPIAGGVIALLRH